MKRTVATLAVVLVASPLYGGQPNLERGGLLYENHCQHCHQSQVHIREQRKAKTLGDVQFQVTRWSREVKLGWSGDDIGDVAAYLYGQYYLPKAPDSEQWKGVRFEDYGEE